MNLKISRMIVIALALALFVSGCSMEKALQNPGTFLGGCLLVVMGVLSLPVLNVISIAPIAIGVIMVIAAAG